MTTLGSLVIPAGRANGKSSSTPFDLGQTYLEVASAVLRHNLTASLAAVVDLGAPRAVVASLEAWTNQDDDAHEPCSLTACRHPLHPGPCKGWKGTLHAVAPGTYKQIEEERVRKANARRLKRIADLKAQNKPIPRRLLEEIKPKPAPQHPAHGASPVPLSQVNQKADLAGGQAHHAGAAVSKAAGVTVKTAPLPLGPKQKKPTVAGRGPAFVITQPKVTDTYKLDKAEKITPQEWDALSAADKTAIRNELTAIKARGFGPQQTKADALLAKLPAPSTLGAPKTAAPSSAPSTTPGKVSLGQAVKTATPQAPGVPQAPAAPNAPSTKNPPKFVHTVTFNGHTITRTSTREYTHASVVQKGHGGEKVVWGFHGSEQAARSTPLTSMQRKNGFHVVDVLPVKREPLKKDTSGAPSAPTPAPGTPVQAPASPLGLHVQQARAVAGRGLPKANLAKTHIVTYSRLTKDDFDSLDANTQRRIRDDLANAKAKFLDPKKKQEAADLLDRFGSRHTSPAPGAPATPTTTSMTPVNVAAKIRKDGSADLILGGKKVTVGFAGGGHDGTLTMAPGGHYFVTTKDGTKHDLAKGQLVQVAVGGPSAPAHPKGYSDPVAQAVAAAHGTDDAAVLQRVSQLSHQQLDTMDAADKKTVTGRLAFIATHPKADPAQKAKAQQLGRLIVTGKPSGLPKLDHEPTLSEIHAHQVKTGHAAQTAALEAADDTKMPRADRITALSGLTKAHFDDLNPQQQRRITDALHGLHYTPGTMHNGYTSSLDKTVGDALATYTGKHPAIHQLQQAEADFRAGKIDSGKVYTELTHARVKAPTTTDKAGHEALDKEAARIARDNPTLDTYVRARLAGDPEYGKTTYAAIHMAMLSHNWEDAPRFNQGDMASLFKPTEADLAAADPIHAQAVRDLQTHVLKTGLGQLSPWSAATKGAMVDAALGFGPGNHGEISRDRLAYYKSLPGGIQSEIRIVLRNRQNSQTNDHAITETWLALRELEGRGPLTGAKRDAALAAADSYASSTAIDTYRKLSPQEYDEFPSYVQAAIKAHLDRAQQRATMGSPSRPWTPQDNALKVFPAALAAHLDGTRADYADRRLRNASDIANYGTAIINPDARTRAYADVPIGQFRNLSAADQAAVTADLTKIANDPGNTLPMRYDALFTKDFTHGGGHNTINAPQLVAIGATDPRSGNQQSDRNVIPALHNLSKADYDSLDRVYRDAIDDRIRSLPGSDQQLLNAKFHPSTAANNPAGVTPTTVQANVPPHVQDALDTIYGVHPKSHTMAHQLSTYGKLRGSDFNQLNPQEQSHLLSDLSFIETTAKGPSATKAKLLIDRFTPAGTAPGQIPPQPIIPPANAVPGQVRYATPLTGVLVQAKDKGIGGDGWTTTPGGKRVWGKYGAAGLLLMHQDPATGEKRYLMVQRGPAISDPGKWQFPGGAIDSKETFHQGGTREVIEELGFKSDALKDAKVHGEHTNAIPGSNWKYVSIAAQVDQMLKPDLSTHHARAETSDAKWMTEAEIRKLDTDGKLLAPLAGGKLEQNVLSLFPQGTSTTLGRVARPGPVTKRQGRMAMPSGGRQSPANFNAWPHAHKPSTGKDLMPDTAAKDKLRQDVKQARVRYDGKTGDGRLAAIGAMQGYDDTPTVVNKSEIDRLLATGDYIEVWRGVKGTYNGKSAAQINEDFRSGTAWYGRGIFGNGYYLATQKRVAEGYSDYSKNSVVRMLIPKSAVIEKYRKIQTEARKNPKMSKAKGKYEDGTLYDAGRWAAAKGIDGIQIDHDTTNDTGGWARHVAKPGLPAFNWLNRAVLIVQEADK